MFLDIYIYIYIYTHTHTRARARACHYKQFIFRINRAKSGRFHQLLFVKRQTFLKKIKVVL